MPLDIASALYDFHTNNNQPGEGPEVYQGATFRRVYIIQDADGNLVDLTGYTGTCQFDKEDGTLVFTATVSIPNPTIGEVEVTIPDSTTAATAPTFGTTSGTICSPADFEFFTDQSQFEFLNFDLWLDDNAGGGDQQVVKGKARFYGSTNV